MDGIKQAARYQAGRSPALPHLGCRMPAVSRPKPTPFLPAPLLLCGRPCERASVKACTSKSHHDSSHETMEQHLGPNAVTKVGDLSKLVFRTATVIRNEALTVEGDARLLHLSIPDNVELLYGRKVQGVEAGARFVDNYTMAGQFVALKLPGGQVASRLYSIASTPYESRRDSSYIDASLIEIVAERNAGAADALLCELEPGTPIQVSQVVGRGFASLLSSVDSFQVALEEGRPLLCVAVGTRGIVPIRALLSWTPVLAHATAFKVSCVYVTRSVTKALFLPEWDAWREAGVNIQPVYSDSWDVDAAAALSSDSQQHAQVVELLEKALFLRDGGFNSLAGSNQDVVVLLAGMSGDVASAVSKKLMTKGIHTDRILFADFF